MIGFIPMVVLVSMLGVMPLAWKWHLGIMRTAGSVGVLALVAGVIVATLGDRVSGSMMLRAGAAWLMTMAAAFMILAYRFYRDPERHIPKRDDVIVSPADGEVLYIREARQGVLPIATKFGRNYNLRELTKTPLHSEDAVIIGIGMSFLDVHVNRAPIRGRIALQRRFHGKFGSLRLPAMVFDNARVTTILEHGALQIAVVQIASRLVRQIASFVGENQEVEMGQRIGVIRFGSQVDLVLPARADLKVLAKPGQRLRAGESVVGWFKPCSSIH